MKKIIIIAVLLSTVILSLSSCVKDLDALPLNPTDYTADVVYGTDEANYLSGLSKIYHSLYSADGVSNVGNTSIASSLVSYWLLGECSTDAMRSAWSAEIWTDMLNYNTWTTVPTDPTYGLYAHSLLGITYANEYLMQTSDEKLNARGIEESVKSNIRAMRTEARFLRAYHYWAMVDAYGNISFVDETHPIGKQAPEMKTRKDAFDWIIAELEDLVSSPDMPQAASNYPRVDKGTALGLLIRMYLNAEVYTGTAMWDKTKETCERLFQLEKYDLCPEYFWLFCGDNGENPEAIKEIMFGNYQNYEHTNWNWGGTTMIIASCANADVLNNGYLTGFGDYWGGLRMPYEYVERFFHPTDVDYSTGEYNIADKRGQKFYIKDRSEKMENLYKFEEGWGVHKYNDIPHNMTAEEYAPIAKTRWFANADYVYMRLGEMYLAYAEACLKLNQKQAGLPYLNALRKRAGYNETLSDYDSEFLFEEYSRELYWESNRRRDLIRFDKYSSGNYLWKWKGGNYDGQSFSKHMEIFAIPVSELQANPNLVQNPGY